MTTEEKDRLEIVKEVCSLQDCTLQEIYNFVKTGKAVTGPLPKNANNPETATLTDGVYFVFDNNTAKLYDGITDPTDEEKDHVIGVGIKQGDRSIIVALSDSADGEELTLTTKEDTTDERCYYKERIDAVADFRGMDNTAHLRSIGLNPKIDLKPGWWVPSVGELYLIYTNRKAIDKALYAIGGEPLADDEWYLTSTETSAADAWPLHLGCGYLGRWRPKVSVKGRVRQVSAFNFNR